MLAILIYIVDSVRRTLRKIVRTVSIIADSYKEAQDYRRNASRLYMEE
jgi:hypothetical protein